MIAEQKRHLQGSPFVIHPFSDFNRMRETIFCLLWTMEMIISPIYMSFVQVEKVRLGLCNLSSAKKKIGMGQDLLFTRLSINESTKPTSTTHF